MAADYLMEHCPQGSPRVGDALVLVQHLTWKPADQMRLARHYLAAQPHAHARYLEAFASFMSLKNYLTVIREVWPTRFEDVGLFRYNLSGAMRCYDTSTEAKRLIDDLFARPPVTGSTGVASRAD